MQRVGSQEETAPHTQELIVKQIMFLCQLLDKEQIEEIQKLIYKALWREKNSVDAIMEKGGVSQWGRSKRPGIRPGTVKSLNASLGGV